MIPECDLCGDTGWITCVGIDGESAYEMACPHGCAVVFDASGIPADAEAPF